VRLSDVWTDGLHRARFYFHHGLLDVMPTRDQLAAGIAERSKWRRAKFKVYRLWSKRSFLLKPYVRQGKGVFVEEPKEPMAGRYTSFRDLRWYHKALSAPAVRGAYLTVLCPEYLLAGYGVAVGKNLIVNHLLYIPHIDIGATWDLQLLQADPGGLDLLERRLEQARSRRGARGKLCRLLAESGGDAERWYATLAELTPRARRFDYAPFLGEPTFVDFLKLCAEIDPRHFGFFKTHSILDPHPEIDWKGAYWLRPPESISVPIDVAFPRHGRAPG
jgi:hypothetical protein